MFVRITLNEGAPDTETLADDIREWVHLRAEARSPQVEVFVLDRVQFEQKEGRA